MVIIGNINVIGDFIQERDLYLQKRKLYLAKRDFYIQKKAGLLIRIKI